MVLGRNRTKSNGRLESRTSAATEGPQPASFVADFHAFAADCLVSGSIDLGVLRMIDLLNERATYQISGAVLHSLSDGHAVRTGALELDRMELVAVHGTGPRGDRHRRIQTIQRGVVVRSGPYTILGFQHRSPAGYALSAPNLPRAMVALTDATVAYAMAGHVLVRRAPVLIINGRLVDSIRAREPGEYLHGKDDIDVFTTARA